MRYSGCDDVPKGRATPGRVDDRQRLVTLQEEADDWSATTGFLGNECEKSSRVVLHDPPKNFIACSGFLELRDEDRQRFRVPVTPAAFRLCRAREIRREHQMIGESGFDERHDH